MRPFVMANSSGGSQTVPPIADYVQARVLAANTAETVTVPAGARIVVFNSDSVFYLRIGGDAAVPAADVTDGTASAMSPGARSLDGVTTFSVVSAAVCIVCMEFFA